MKYADIDRIYRKIPLDNIPWNSETPPDALVRLVQDGKVRPCRTVDLGCGAGNYAIYLAGLGFEVTGVDSSPTAITIAKEHAEKRRARCRFIVADLLGGLQEVTGMFDFAYDWEFLHHIFPEEPGDLYQKCPEDPEPGGNLLLCLLQRERPPVWRQREIPDDPDRDNTLFLLGIRTAGSRLPVFHHPGTEDH